MARRSKMKIDVYTKENCSYCVMAKAFLNAHNISYNEILLTKETIPNFKEQYPQLKTLPQIFVNGDLLGGYDELLISRLQYKYHDN